MDMIIFSATTCKRCHLRWFDGDGEDEVVDDGSGAALLDLVEVHEKEDGSVQGCVGCHASQQHHHALAPVPALDCIPPGTLLPYFAN
jgi:hypothetical protein